MGQTEDEELKRMVETGKIADTELWEETRVVPVIAETLTVGKQTVITGGVRLTKRVSEREETADEPLRQEKVHVERVSINQMVAEAPEPRQEGDTLIIPVLEEILVVEKRLLLKEEVRITRTRSETNQPQTMTLRSEEVVLEDITHP